MKQPANYTNAPVTTVQCPRCSSHHDLPMVGLEAWSLEFSGVCSTPVADGGLCSTTLRLFVTSHLAPAG